MPAVRRPGASNQATQPGGAAAAPSCQHVHRETQPIMAGELLAPACRLVAVHHVQEGSEVGALQLGLDFGGKLQGRRQVPLRHDAGVHQQPASFVHRHAALAQPVEPGLALGAGEDLAERVAGMQRPHTMGHGKQVQVVVAEQAARRVAQAAQPAQRGQRLRAAVDQVAEHKEAVARRRKGQCRQQVVECVAAALQVAHQVVHGSILLRSPSRVAARPAWTLPFLSS
jgi:hypothetical protein